MTEIRSFGKGLALALLIGVGGMFLTSPLEAHGEKKGDQAAMSPQQHMMRQMMHQMHGCMQAHMKKMKDGGQAMSGDQAAMRKTMMEMMKGCMSQMEGMNGSSGSMGGGMHGHGAGMKDRHSGDDGGEGHRHR